MVRESDLLLLECAVPHVLGPTDDHDLMASVADFNNVSGRFAVITRCSNCMRSGQLLDLGIDTLSDYQPRQIQKNFLVGGLHKELSVLIYESTFTALQE